MKTTTKFLSSLVLAAFTSVVYSQSSEEPSQKWVVLVEGSNGSVSALEHSYRESSNKDLGSLFVRLIRPNQNDSYSVAIMKKEDCTAGVGKIYFSDGEQIQFDSTYIRNGPSFAHLVGDAVCSVLLDDRSIYDDNLKKNNPDGANPRKRIIPNVQGKKIET